MSNTAMSGAALVQSTIAMQMAHEADVRSCKAYIGSYHAETATVGQMQEYGNCVHTVYPEEIGPDAILALKIVLVVAFVGMALGWWRCKDDHFSDGPLDYFMYGIAGFFIVPVGIGAVLALLVGFLWLVGVL